MPYTPPPPSKDARPPPEQESHQTHLLHTYTARPSRPQLLLKPGLPDCLPDPRVLPHAMPTAY